MTISGALNNALSGLRATGRGTEVVASNLANAMTPGYGKRSLSLSSMILGDTGGVRVNGVYRDVNERLVSDRRMAGAEQGFHKAATAFLNRFENVLGTPDQPGSLAARLADFESSLVLASSRPDATERLGAAVTAARDLAIGLNRASEAIQQSRSDADRSIGNQVNRLNDALTEVKTLNVRITAAGNRGESVAALQDHRQQLIDEISEMVPVRQIPRDHGAVALFSTGGAILLDGQAATIEFAPVNIVTPYMTVDSGTLSGLTINGTPIDISSDQGPLRGGTLSAQFAVRDELGVTAQSQIDAVARDLIERFEDPTLDSTRSPTDPGLFTDAGALLNPAAEVGLSSRISVNAVVDPAKGGESWRLRDGLGATTPGAVGDATLLQALTDVFSLPRTPASGNFGTAAYTALDLTVTLTSQLAADRLQSETRLAFATTQFQELKQQELADGVDTDAELQRMLILEQAYAANARVIEAADEMMQALLRI